MAISARGRRILQYGKTADMFARLAEADPTADQRIDPWNGQSPRDLTEASIRFSLGHEGASLNAEDARIEEQCRRHLHGY